MKGRFYVFNAGRSLHSLFFFFGIKFLYSLNILSAKIQFHLHVDEKNKEQRKKLGSAIRFGQNCLWSNWMLTACVSVCTICTTREKYWPQRIFSLHFGVHSDSGPLFSPFSLTLSSSLVVCFVVVVIVVVVIVVSRKSLVKFA